MAEPRPTIFIIFGITGEWAGKKLLPALLSLYAKKILPQDFIIIGVARRQFSREDFRQHIRENLNIRRGQIREEDIKHFIDHIEYENGIFDNKELYFKISERIKLIEGRWRQYANKLFHLAVPPHLYETILNKISDAVLYREYKGENDKTWTRILIEKPFGKDINMAIKIDKLLGNLFDERQIFRIDHYLAKESIQNILTFRFSNVLFEPIWNYKYVDKVHIRLLEKETIGNNKAIYYDSMGALKDVGQNHILQMLAIIAMERPKDFKSEYIRSERAKILHHLIQPSAKDISENFVRARYEGYDKEKGVFEFSKTETYFLMKCFINNNRWKGVPFFLESGKAMREDRADISIYFKNEENPEQENILVFRIQPDEGIKIRFWSKTSGLPLEIEPKTLSFKYKDEDDRDNITEAYEKLLFDAIIGDQTLFASTDEVMSSWKFITPIIENIHKTPLLTYKKGSAGPF